MIYFLIVLIATTSGGIAGMGGGFIIKPVLDFLGVNISVAAVLAAVTVLAMCITSIAKQVRTGFSIDRKMIFLTASSLVGAVLGNMVFNLALAHLSDETVNMMQIGIAIALMVLALLKEYLSKVKFEHLAAYGIAGLLLGLFSTFVGIGGGSINVAVLVAVFGFDIKRAVVTSLFMIMIAQLMNVAIMMIQGDMFGYDLSALWFMLPAAIIGGLGGAFISRKLKPKHVNVIFIVVVCCIIALNVYNLVKLVA